MSEHPQTWHYGLVAQWWAEFNVASPERRRRDRASPVEVLARGRDAARRRPRAVDAEIACAHVSSCLFATIMSAHRKPSAPMVLVGLQAPPVVIALPSQMKRLGTSHDW